MPFSRSAPAGTKFPPGFSQESGGLNVLLANPAVTFDAGDTAWVLAAAALVLFMTPGLAFFYGGMVRSKNVLGMLMQNYFSMGLVSVLWAFFVFSLAFGDGGKFIGDFTFAGLKDLGNIDLQLPGYVGDFALTIPPLAFC